MSGRSHLAYLSKQESYFRTDRSEMLEFVPMEARRVVEFGCGAGMFAERIKQRQNAYTVGVELVARPAALAADRLDKVFQRDIEQGLEFLAGETFDCAVFLDVLEHLRSPWDVLTELKSYLAPGGAVIASIPNLRHFEVMKSLLLRRRFEYRDEGVLDRTHLRFFTREDILQLFATTGFTVNRIAGLKGRFPWKFKLLDRLTGGALSDMQFLQFAVVAAWIP
jgi:2-polyprenyl-3-methyl-5-hydroxy-6-metoxy-1,4-benzoquinol methylase